MPTRKTSDEKASTEKMSFINLSLMLFTDIPFSAFDYAPRINGAR